MPLFLSLTHCRRLFVRVLTGRCVTLRRSYRSPIWAAAPRVGASRHGRVGKSVVVVVEGVGRVVLRVLQPRDQSLIFVSEVAPHQGGLADNHHVLGGQREVRTRRPLLVRHRSCIVHSRWVWALSLSPLVCRPLRFWNRTKRIRT